MVTPFTPDGAVNYALAETTGRSSGRPRAVMVWSFAAPQVSLPRLTWDEEYQLYKVVKQAVAGRSKK